MRRALVLRLFYVVLIIFRLCAQTSCAAKSNACSQCKLLVETFKTGMKKTENQHFAGGNSDWEERNLGRFATSETRLVEIMDYLCKTKNLGNSEEFSNIKNVEFKCHQMVEEHEESIENWYYYKQYSDPDMLVWFCHEKLCVCCNDGYFGSDCKPCPGVDKGLEPCFGHGTCQGNGLREGNGKCHCHKGYVGLMCNNCDANYYAVQSQSSLICKDCHVACLGGCRGEGPKNCNSCGRGWTMNNENECIDVDECLDESVCKGEHSLCINSAGSFECSCETGFIKNHSGICKLDVNEQNVNSSESVLNGDQQADQDDVIDLENKINNSKKPATEL